LTLVIEELAKITLQLKRINLWTMPIVGKYCTKNAKREINKSWFKHCFYLRIFTNT